MIFTFYSYKGGVGRSMALANIAELFYQAGLKVLMLDWDLEAPGLERFFFSQKNMDEVLAKPGLIDMLQIYKDRLAKEWKLTEGENLPSPFPPLDQFVQKIASNTSNGGQLSLITAGKRSKSHFDEYAQRVLAFDWQDFYQDWEGERYIEWLRQQFEQMADVVLVDSRTGVTEIGGICTYHLADTVIMFCAPNLQNLEGTYHMARNLSKSTVQALRPNRPLDVLVIPARIERAEGTLVDEFQEKFIVSFADFVPQVNGFTVEQLWDVRIPYIPKYAFMESIAVREASRESAKDMAEAFTGLAQILISKWKEKLPRKHPLYNKLDREDVFLEYHSNSSAPLPPCLFVAGPMIKDPRIFVGRRQELQALSSRLMGVQPISINVVGARRIGKSSLLYHFFQTWEQRVTRPEFYQVIYLSLQNARCQKKTHFYQFVAQTLLYRPRVRAEVALREPWQTLPHTYQGFTTAIEAWKNVGVLPVLCLDEFEAFLQYPTEFDDAFFDGLRALMDNNLLLLIIASHKHLDTYRDQHRLTSSFFNIGHILTLGNLTETETTDLLRLPASTITGSQAVLSTDEQHRARQWAGHHPFHLQLAATFLCEARQQGLSIAWAKAKFDAEIGRLSESSFSLRYWTIRIIIIIIIIIIMVWGFLSSFQIFQFWGTS